MDANNPYDEAQNPYQEFGSTEVGFGPDGEIILPPGQRRGWIGHVQVAGWLMAIQAVLQLLFSFLFLGLAIFLPDVILAQAQNNPTLQDQGMDPDKLSLLIRVIYGAMGGALFLISLLMLFAGVQVIRFRAYGLGVAGFSVSFLTLMAGCYCFATALPLGIYGLVVMLNPSVKKGFEIGKKGYTSKQITEAFKDLPS